MTVEDLLDTRHAAGRAGQTDEPGNLRTRCAKFTTNFLVLRARVLSLYGRWRESLAELDAYAATHPDSPYQIDVDYYRARALTN